MPDGFPPPAIATDVPTPAKALAAAMTAINLRKVPPLGWTTKPSAVEVAIRSTILPGPDTARSATTWDEFLHVCTDDATRVAYVEVLRMSALQPSSGSSVAPLPTSPAMAPRRSDRSLTDESQVARVRFRWDPSVGAGDWRSEEQKNRTLHPHPSRAYGASYRDSNEPDVALGGWLDW